MRNRKLFKFAQVSALCGVFAMPWIGPASAILQTHANDDPIHIDSDDPRYELGYDYYELRELPDGRYHVDVTGLGDHWGEMVIDITDTDSESSVSFEITTEIDDAEVTLALLDEATLVVEVDETPFILAEDDGSGAYDVYVSSQFPEVDASDSLAMFADVLTDEHFRGEFGQQQIDGGATIVVLTLIGLGIAATVGIVTWKMGCGTKAVACENACWDSKSTACFDFLNDCYKLGNKGKVCAILYNACNNTNLPIECQLNACQMFDDEGCDPPYTPSIWFHVDEVIPSPFF